MTTHNSKYKLYEDFKTPTDTVYDTEAIKNSIRNILLTPLGTAPGRPDFGSRLLEVPFNLNDFNTKVLIARVVYEALIKWEPRIVFNGIDIDQKENTVKVNIKYRFRDSSLSGSVALNLFEWGYNDSNNPF